jgi:hypothetical protein
LLRLERLETRLCPATSDFWQPVVGTWNTPGDWSLGHAPLATNNEDAVFDGGKSNSGCLVGLVGAPLDLIFQNKYTGTLSIGAGDTLQVKNEALLDNGPGNPVNIDLSTGAVLKINGTDSGTSKIRDPNFTHTGTVEIAGSTTKFIGSDGGTTTAGFKVDPGATLQFSNTAPTGGNGAITFKGGAGITNNGTVTVDDNNNVVAQCSATDSPNTTFSNNTGGTLSFTSSTSTNVSSINISLLNNGTVNITKGQLKFKGSSKAAGGYDVEMASGTINLDQGGQLGFVDNGYLQAGGSLNAKGSTEDYLSGGAGAAKFNGGNVSMGDGSNTYNTLGVFITSGDTYVDGATFNFKVNTAQSGQSDRLEVFNGTLHIDKNGGKSTMQWTMNGTPVASGSWIVIKVDSMNNIDGDFTNKNLPAGYTETETSTWTLSK